MEEIYKNLNITWWRKYSLDLNTKGASKLRGIKMIIDHYHFNINNIVTIGDGENDSDMIKNFAMSVAMGNSIQKIKDLADYVTSDIDDNGIEKAFKHYNII